MIKHGTAAGFCLGKIENIAIEKLVPGRQAFSKESPALHCAALTVVDLVIALERSLEE